MSRPGVESVPRRVNTDPVGTLPRRMVFSEIEEHRVDQDRARIKRLIDSDRDAVARARKERRHQELALRQVRAALRQARMRLRGVA